MACYKDSFTHITLESIPKMTYVNVRVVETNYTFLISALKGEGAMLMPQLLCSQEPIRSERLGGRGTFPVLGIKNTKISCGFIFKECIFREMESWQLTS